MFAGVIQARIGSQRCKNKMLREFAGSSLLRIALEKFSRPTAAFKFYFAAYEEELLTVAREYPGEIIRRNAESARGERIETVMNYLAEIPAKNIIFINACCPFLTLKTVEEAVAEFIARQARSLTATVPTHTWYYYPDGRPVNFPDPTNLSTKTSEPLQAVTHSIHIFNRRRFLENHYFWNHAKGDPIFFNMPALEAIDIDTELDFEMAEALYRKKFGCADSLPPGIRRKLSGIKMLLLDLDGVMTDAGMYYSARGEELKKFNTRDAMGLARLRAQGIKVGIISGENSEIARARAQKLKIEDLYLGIKDKAAVLDEILTKHGLATAEIAYLGDDLNDVPIMHRIGIPCAVADAAPETKAAAMIITRRRGGEGAVREICEMMLKTVRTA